MRNFWKKEEVDLLVKLGKDHTSNEIAKKLNRPLPTVRWYLRKKGISTRPRWVRPQTLNKKIYDYSRKHTWKETSEKFKISLISVGKVIGRYKKNLKKFHDNLDPDRLDSLRKFAYNLGLRRGLPIQLAEDFSMLAVAKQLEMGSIGVNLGFLYINFIEQKENMQNKRNVAYEEGIAAFNPNEEKENDPDSDERFKKILKGLKMRDRTILFLRFAHDIKREDIAFCLGISTTMVDYYYRTTINKLRKKIKIQ